MAVQTPRRVAIRTSLLVALVSSLVYVFTSLLLKTEISSLFIFILFTATAISSYLLFFFSLEKFIYQKVKLIYKTIHKFKGGGQSRKQISMDEDVLEKVSKEVQNWAETSIQEIRELKKADSFRQEFIGNLSHELKTPIHSIQGYILTLLEGALEDPDNNRKFLNKAAKSVQRLTALIDDLDNITNLESGNVELKTERFDIVELVREVIEALEHKKKQQEIRLKMSNSNQPPVFVKADRMKIAQVLTNLLNNSINYGTKGGTTAVKFFDMDENILIEVADDGLGMAPVHLNRIFERFYRIDKSRSRHVGGSGLGLAIVKHIIDAHDQTINVRSTEGMGSTFSFTLQKA